MFRSLSECRGTATIFPVFNVFHLKFLASVGQTSLHCPATLLAVTTDILSFCSMVRLSASKSIALKMKVENPQSDIFHFLWTSYAFFTCLILCLFEVDSSDLGSVIKDRWGSQG